MRSRVLAIVLTAVALAAFGGAAFFIRVSEQQIASVRTRTRTFDAAVRETTSSILAFDADRTVASLAALGSLATNDGARASLEHAATDAANLTDSVAIFEQLSSARAAEQQAADRTEATTRAREAVALAGAAGLGLVVLLLLAGMWPTSSSREADTAVAAPASAPVPSIPSVLRAASDLCTSLGRVSDVEELRTLIGHAAELMDASGLIVWINAPGASELRPALSHGYPQEMLSRLPPLPRSADNAAARAFRTGQFQIVLARPGTSEGAVVAPLLTPAGCVGVISAEIRGGGETSDVVQALAAIFAAQLANVVHVTPQSHEQRATGTAGL
ncbi:MAG TPA: GAF domain-containing protein [Vicinamibacterales bacterium]|nr:GAF domain-containing protein [Vicinamibacterales bacterium]